MKSEDRRRLIDVLLDHADKCDECAYKLDDMIADCHIEGFKPTQQKSENVS